MNRDTQRALDRAAHSIHAAEILLDGSEPEFAAVRAYYAMLYTAQALLGERGFTFKTHGSVHGQYGRHFAQTGLLDPKYHRWMIAAFNLRLEGDYSLSPSITHEHVVELIGRAREFLAVARRFLGVPGAGDIEGL